MGPKFVDSIICDDVANDGQHNTKYGKTKMVSAPEKRNPENEREREKKKQQKCVATAKVERKRT